MPVWRDCDAFYRQRMLNVCPAYLICETCPRKETDPIFCFCPHAHFNYVNYIQVFLPYKLIHPQGLCVLLWCCDVTETTAVSCLKSITDRPPCDPLHDQVLTGLQVFDDVFAQRGFGLDEALNDFVEVEGGELEHIQDPREADVCFHWFATEVEAPSLKTALWKVQKYSCITCTHDS